jgi:hypothetical protein
LYPVVVRRNIRFGQFYQAGSFVWCKLTLTLLDSCYYLFVSRGIDLCCTR